MSAALASLYDGFSVANYFSKARSFHDIKNGQLLQHGHANQLLIANVKMRDAHACRLQNGEKTEMFSPQNDCRTKRNVNFFIGRYCSLCLPVTHVSTITCKMGS